MAINWMSNQTIRTNQGDTSNFVTSGEWDLTEFSVKRNTEVYACCPEFYPDVTFTLLIKRRTRYYYINMLLPNMFITGQSCTDISDGTETPQCHRFDSCRRGCGCRIFLTYPCMVDNLEQLISD